MIDIPESGPIELEDQPAQVDIGLRDVFPVKNRILHFANIADERLGRPSVGEKTQNSLANGEGHG